MSSIVNKIKDAVTPSHSTSDPEGTHGPHGSKVANAADPRVDSDRDGSHGTTTGTGLTSGNHGLTGSAPNTAGPHSSDMANRIDPRVDSDRDNSKTLGGNTTTGHNVPEGTHGPHGSKIANTLDPRVDSDRDRTIGPNSGAATGGAFGSATGAGTGTHFTSGTHGTSEGLHGPHGSRVANAADPRVDSDRDHSTTLGGNTHGSTFGSTGTHGTSEGLHGPHSSRTANALDPRVDSDRDGGHPGSGIGHTSSTGTHFTPGTHGTSGTSGTSEGLHGPHSSRIANAADPRVDSDRDGSKTVGNTTGTGYGTAEGTHGPHGSRIANAADPRVDSDRDGRAAHPGGNATSTGDHIAGHAGAALGGARHTGPAPNTAGPHKSDMLNKLDPRVDSDLDGSKTIGGDKTFAQS